MSKIKTDEKKYIHENLPPVEPLNWEAQCGGEGDWRMSIRSGFDAAGHMYVWIDTNGGPVPLEEDPEHRDAWFKMIGCRELPDRLRILDGCLFAGLALDDLSRALARAGEYTEDVSDQIGYYRDLIEEAEKASLARREKK